MSESAQEITYSQRLLRSGKGLLPWQRRARFIQAARQIAAIRPSGRVETLIDIGAADGIGMSFWTPVAEHILACNYYQLHSREFHQAYPENSIATTDARRLPFRDRCADAVVSLETLHLLPSIGDRQKCMAEARRVLKPDGVFVCSVPIEVGLPALPKYIARQITKVELAGMTFGTMIRHVLYPFYDVSKDDKGRQVGFNAYRFARDLADHFKVVRRIYIPFPYPLSTNLMLVCSSQ